MHRLTVEGRNLYGKSGYGLLLAFLEGPIHREAFHQLFECIEAQFAAEENPCALVLDPPAEMLISQHPAHDNRSPICSALQTTHRLINHQLHLCRFRRGPKVHQLGSDLVLSYDDDLYRLPLADIRLANFSQ